MLHAGRRPSLPSLCGPHQAGWVFGRAAEANVNLSGPQAWQGCTFRGDGSSITLSSRAGDDPHGPAAALPTAQSRPRGAGGGGGKAPTRLSPPGDARGRWEVAGSSPATATGPLTHPWAGSVLRCRTERSRENFAVPRSYHHYCFLFQ